LTLPLFLFLKYNIYCILEIHIFIINFSTITCNGLFNFLIAIQIQRTWTSTGGNSTVCGGIATQIASYNMVDATLVEKYCDTCLAREIN
jgi:hypothetical protein